MNYTEIKMPLIDVNDDKAKVTEILFAEGEFVRTGEVVLSAENTKATSDVVSPRDGYFLPLCKPFDERKSGDTIAIIFESEAELATYKKSGNNASMAGNIVEVNATKKAIALATELGISIAQIADEKGGGVVKEKDVETYAANHNLVSEKKQKPVFELKRERVVIIGAGYGAEVVIDILLDYPDIEIVGLVDDNVKQLRNYKYTVLDCGIKDFPDKYGSDFYDSVIISIGANFSSMKFRRQVFEDYTKRGVSFTNAISKSAEIRRGVQIGVGNIIGSGCYIGTLTRIGDNNSISYGTNIGHHNIIGSHNLIAPGVFTSGADVIGDSCIIPAGVAVVNRAIIGDDVVVPVGYAVTNNLESGSVIKNKY
ncbi:PglD-related sugar-binding protein [Butyrivibrio sp. YAB3001]|uniref:PglD-related sugar-binding protein n=1 Tax=Butyrivibrio sp. YAB3001 TaxID=1520812 RepID=UPI0008F68FB7|nr:hypothetical protein [Butyrivibrio sp. YAB3001]SFB94318.1 Biotin-requiring enzyme [Butyrivibrio sp. YAB3001]